MITKTGKLKYCAQLEGKQNIDCLIAMIVSFFRLSISDTAFDINFRASFQLL